jgi:hypothetical protein
MPRRTGKYVTRHIPTLEQRISVTVLAQDVKLRIAYARVGTNFACTSDVLRDFD